MGVKLYLTLERKPTMIILSVFFLILFVWFWEPKEHLDLKMKSFCNHNYHYSVSIRWSAGLRYLKQGIHKVGDMIVDMIIFCLQSMANTSTATDTYSVCFQLSDFTCSQCIMLQLFHPAKCTTGDHWEWVKSTLHTFTLSPLKTSAMQSLCVVFFSSWRLFCVLLKSNRVLYLS